MPRTNAAPGCRSGCLPFVVSGVRHGCGPPRGVAGCRHLLTTLIWKGLIFMPQRTSYKQGTPSWVDLQTTDVDAAKAFYGGLFGWKFDDQPMPDDAPYSMALVGADTVAAIAPQSPMQAEMNIPPM